MPGDVTLEAAAQRLKSALDRLDRAVETQLEREEVVRSAEEEVQLQTADRGRLAEELDGALARAQRLEMTNREVSNRLVAAMETIRAVIERQKHA